MAEKLKKGLIPGNGTLEDFRCFGPVANHDGDFAAAMLADLGCFKQGDVDSNKYYHAAIVQCRSNGQWYVYFEWGRTGNKNPQFMFVECASKDEAHREFEKQLHEKNDKRGHWVTVGGIRTLEAKPGKDVYLVREQASRVTGLPDAKNITSEVKITRAVSAKSKSTIHPQVASLLSDLSVGTIAYTRASMCNDVIPSQKAIDEARSILAAARARIAVVPRFEDQINDRDLILLTNTIYSRIPKIKNRGAAVSEWLLSDENIDKWDLDLNAFESALGAVKFEDSESNPYGELPLELDWHGNAAEPLTDMAKWICEWMPLATNNKHSYLGSLRIRGIWAIHRKDRLDDISSFQKLKCGEERPLFQKAIKNRPDLSFEQRKAWWNSNTAFLFHGTRSCNVRGILNTALKMPAQLVGVATTAAMFGHAIYFADDFKKSVGYTSHDRAVYTRANPGKIPNRRAFIFLGDVALGNTHVATRPKGFIEPPAGYNSVMGKGGYTETKLGNRLQNNEYIVYNSRQNTLKYLIEFECSPENWRKP